MKNNYVVLILVTVVTVALAVGGYYVFKLASQIGKKSTEDEKPVEDDKPKNPIDEKDTDEGGGSTSDMQKAPFKPSSPKSLPYFDKSKYSDEMQDQQAQELKGVRKIVLV